VATMMEAAAAQKMMSKCSSNYKIDDLNRQDNYYKHSEPCLRRKKATPHSSAP
jgi:hypothetical protein